MLTIFTWIKGYASIALLIFAAAGWGAAGIEKMRISSLKLEAAQTAQKAAAARAEQEATVRMASENFRRTEADLRDKADESKRKYDALQTQHAPVLAALAAARVDNGRMRDQLSAYAAPRDTAATDSVAACRERAEALGGLLERALQADGEHAAAAEVNADGVREVLAAWPK